MSSTSSSGLEEGGDRSSYFTSEMTSCMESRGEVPASVGGSANQQKSAISSGRMRRELEGPSMKYQEMFNDLVLPPPDQANMEQMMSLG